MREPDLVVKAVPERLVQQKTKQINDAIILQQQ
jgi:hypothetical protein